MDLIIEKDNDSVLLKLLWKILDELNLFMKKIMCIVMKDIINICDIRKLKVRDLYFFIYEIELNFGNFWLLWGYFRDGMFKKSFICRKI